MKLFQCLLNALSGRFAILKYCMYIYTRGEIMKSIKISSTKPIPLLLKLAVIFPIFPSFVVHEEYVVSKVCF